MKFGGQWFHVLKAGLGGEYRASSWRGPIWIGIEDEFEAAERSEIDPRVRRAIEQDLSDPAPHQTAERLLTANGDD